MRILCEVETPDEKKREELTRSNMAEICPCKDCDFYKWNLEYLCMKHRLCLNGRIRIKNDDYRRDNSRG